MSTKYLPYTMMIILSIMTVIKGQLPHTFTQTAHKTTNGNALGVAVGADGTIFLGNGPDGLRAYSYNGTSFTNTAHINTGSTGNGAYGVAVGPDGTIFLGNQTDGLRAYSYDGTSLTNTAHIDDGEIGWGVMVGSDGTIFLANGEDGLRAYSYDGTSLTNIAHKDDGGFAHSIAVGADGSIFLAAAEDGLKAYTYSGYLGIENELSSIPGKYELFQNYPNPFNPVSTIQYDLPKGNGVSLIVYDILGREVEKLVDGYMEPGYHQTMWDSRNSQGRELPSGIYIARLVTLESTKSIKMLLLK